MSRPTSPGPVVLAFQVAYGCRHSGRCCTAPWPIPVDAGRAEAVRAAFGREVTQAGLLPKDSSGACTFYDREAGRCAIHHQLGPRALPVSCAHFPRRLLIEDDRIAITLSHYCPTVAGLLFDASAETGIVEADHLLEGIAPEGLDARGAWPPLLRPGVLAGVGAYRRWEHAVVETLAAARGGPEAALARVSAMTARVVSWTAGDGPLEDWVDEQDGVEVESPSASGVCAEELVTAWGGFERPVGRFLAAKAFGSWSAYQSDGLEAVLREVVAAHEVLREEAAAACRRAGRALDRPLFIEAAGQADLRMMHAEDGQETQSTKSRGHEVARSQSTKSVHEA